MAKEMPELSDIAQMNKRELVTLWKKVFGKSPQFMGSKAFLKHLLAEELQGGMPPALRRQLNKLKPKKITLKLGTIIEKEWHGKKYSVITTKEGFIYNNQTYSSLTQIAKEITGTAWNGPAFFGLRK